MYNHPFISDVNKPPCNGHVCYNRGANNRKTRKVLLFFINNNFKPITISNTLFVRTLNLFYNLKFIIVFATFQQNAHTRFIYHTLDLSTYLCTP